MKSYVQYYVDLKQERTVSPVYQDVVVVVES